MIKETSTFKKEMNILIPDLPVRPTCLGLHNFGLVTQMFLPPTESVEISKWHAFKKKERFFSYINSSL